jgi:hypothetical protein
VWRINCYRGHGDSPLRFEPHPVRAGRFQTSQWRVCIPVGPTFTEQWDFQGQVASSLACPARSSCPALQIDGEVVPE